jgi:hypothetical protein
MSTLCVCVYVPVRVCTCPRVSSCFVNRIEAETRLGISNCLHDSSLVTLHVDVRPRHTQRAHTYRPKLIDAAPSEDLTQPQDTHAELQRTHPIGIELLTCLVYAREHVA